MATRSFSSPPFCANNGRYGSNGLNVAACSTWPEFGFETRIGAAVVVDNFVLITGIDVLVVVVVVVVDVVAIIMDGVCRWFNVWLASQGLNSSPNGGRFTGGR
ncbi:hypothetical protein BLA29_002585 [Euroglyphus maynei]|uniref:Uncharacterized protein n=1 Tax=Euroglyphus maynei TaxID=6958 RepID=A0A1Y3BHK6_EURMA|nr:hypothetical protein BLA29_002585 [Euroglyphus maynei]